MKRLLLGAALLWSCGTPPQPKGTAKTEGKPSIEYFRVDPAITGTVRGAARLEGKAPAPKRISMDADADCQKLHTAPVFDSKVRVGKSGGLANVFVYVKQGLEDKSFEPAGTAVVLDQRGCQFVPRVVALRSGQVLTVKNSDPVSHNIHPMPANNRDWNQQQAPGAEDLRRRFARAEVMIPVKCNIHNWMRSYIAVVDHPFFAVSGENGEFSLPGLPQGEYTLAAWHEAYGEQVQTIRIAAGAVAEAPFQFR